MEISATAQTASSSSQSSSETSSEGPSLSSDFETFLKMLTVQMKYQDPLNPVDSSEYAMQLATFSSVEQQVMTNDLLENMSAQLGAMGMSQLAGWVGMEARNTAPALFDTVPIDLVAEPNSLADVAELVVRDASGTEVQRLAIETTGGQLSWAGVTGDGDAMPSGLYTFEIESFSNGELLETTAAENYAKISEARVGSSGIMLVLSGGSEIAANDIGALRQARL